MWFTASSALLSPYNDLQFFQSLIVYKSENEKTATAAIKKFVNHFWYLSPELVGLAFFDDRIPLDIKRKMVLAIKTRVNNCEIPLKKLEINDFDTELELWKTRSIDELIYKSTKNLFDRFNLKTDFLLVDPTLWEQNDSYIEAKHCLQHLRVINDTAERGVALIKKFNSTLTKNEEQLQYLLQFVNIHRKMFPNAVKSNM